MSFSNRPFFFLGHPVHEEILYDVNKFGVVSENFIPSNAIFQELAYHLRIVVVVFFIALRTDGGFLLVLCCFGERWGFRYQKSLQKNLFAIIHELNSLFKISTPPRVQSSQPYLYN